MMFMLGAGALFARSGQCQGAGLYDTGYQMAVAGAQYLQHSASSAVESAMSSDFEVFSEELVGDGSNYTGRGDLEAKQK